MTSVRSAERTKAAVRASSTVIFDFLTGEALRLEQDVVAVFSLLFRSLISAACGTFDSSIWAVDVRSTHLSPFMNPLRPFQKDTLVSIGSGVSLDPHVSLDPLISFLSFLSLVSLEQLELLYVVHFP